MPLTWIEVIVLGHFDGGSRLLLDVRDRLSSLADDGPSSNGRHKHFEADAVCCNIQSLIAANEAADSPLGMA